MRAPLFLFVDAVASERQRRGPQEPPPEPPRRGSRRVRLVLIAAVLILVATPIAVAHAEAVAPVPLPPASAPAGPAARAQTLASGARSVKRAGAYSLRVRPSRRGRTLLRHSQRLQNVTVVLAFKARSGSALVQSTTLALRR
jgi:hypothetical protein